MSLTTDGLALGAAFMIVVGSAVQARQAYTELNEITPAGSSLIPLYVAAITVGFLVTISWHRRVSISVRPIRPGLITPTPNELTPEQVTALPHRQAAVLAAGKDTALTTDQAAARAGGKPIHLTVGQIAAINAERAKDTKKWMGFLLGWLFILIGALAALLGAAVMLANDLTGTSHI